MDRGKRVNWNILVTRGKENKSVIPLVAASERGLAQTTFSGVVGLQCEIKKYSWTELESSAKDGESPVSEMFFYSSSTWVVPDTWNPVWICQDHLGKAKYCWWPIVNKYSDGKVKRTPSGEWNRTWNRMHTSDQSTIRSVMICLLKNEPAS